MVAGLLLSCIALVAVQMGLDPSNLGLVTTATLVGQLHAASAAMATVAGALCMVRWRLVGDARSLWIGTGLVVLGCFAIGAGGLGLSGARSGVLAALHAASLVVGLSLLTYALAVPEVDARLRLWMPCAAALAVVAATLVALLVLPAFAQANPGGDLFAATTGGLVVILATIVALAIVYLVRGLRQQRLALAWLGLMLLGLAVSECLLAMVPAGGHGWALGGALTQACSFLVGLTGPTLELQHAYQEQSRRLLETRVETLTNEARIRADQALQQERAHEARNALAAIEGATLTLERHREALDPETRQALTLAVSGEIARLQRLVSAEHVESFRITFRVIDVVDPQVALARSQGAQVLADVPTDLFAVGRPADTAEVLQNLLINAQRYGRDEADSPIVVRAGLERGRIVVRVEDRGAGVPAAKRASIFERGRRATHGVPGSGLGLYVSAQLMRDQDGQLWVEGRKGGGASFALSLPPAAAEQSGSAGFPPVGVAGGDDEVAHV